MADSTRTGIEQRVDPRLPLDEAVSIEFPAEPITGSGRNISLQGVFFTAPMAVAVSVRIAGHAEPVPGELVRVETMGDGRVGIAVRFREPQPGLIPN
ncbi:MAG: PilZ domain-containing protein [Planctomycetes bacterium]|nr:PilZ domain-containing protein [Planctomycetota bacterium]